jgi:hypothetical protein
MNGIQNCVKINVIIQIKKNDHNGLQSVHKQQQRNEYPSYTSWRADIVETAC